VTRPKHSGQTGVHHERSLEQILRSRQQTRQEVGDVKTLLAADPLQRSTLAQEFARGMRPGYAQHLLQCVKLRGRAVKDCDLQWGPAGEARHQCILGQKHTVAHRCACGVSIPRVSHNARV